MGFVDLILKTSYIASHVHSNYIFVHSNYVLYMLSDYVLVGLDWAEPMMQFSFACHMFMHSHAYVLSFQYIFIYLNCFGTFLRVSFFPPHSLVYISAS